MGEALKWYQTNFAKLKFKELKKCYNDDNDELIELYNEKLSLCKNELEELIKRAEKSLKENKKRRDAEHKIALKILKEIDTFQTKTKKTIYKYRKFMDDEYQEYEVEPGMYNNFKEGVEKTKKLSKDIKAELLKNFGLVTGKTLKNAIYNKNKGKNTGVLGSLYTAYKSFRDVEKVKSLLSDENEDKGFVSSWKKIETVANAGTTESKPKGYGDIVSKFNNIDSDIKRMYKKLISENGVLDENGTEYKNWVGVTEPGQKMDMAGFYKVLKISNLYFKRYDKLNKDAKNPFKRLGNKIKRHKFLVTVCIIFFPITVAFAVMMGLFFGMIAVSGALSSV